MTVWHYTTNDERHGGKILSDGVLQPRVGMTAEFESDYIELGFSRSAVRRIIAEDAATRPAVWFSLEQHFEPSAKCSSSMAELHELAGILRIGVAPSVCPGTWNDYCRESGQSAKALREMKSAAYRMGSRPSNYRLSWTPVWSANWIAVEVFDGANWVQDERAFKITSGE